jgi:hypothetical protein
MVIVLALSLSWIPYIGPIVAGFVGGRRAGSIVRGFVVGVAGSIIVFGIAFLLNLGLVKLFEPDYQSFIDTLEAISPSIVTGLETISSYLSDNFVAVSSDISVSVKSQTYASLIGFAMIGGVFADQARKELRIIVSQSMEVNRPRPARSTSSFVAGRDIGFQNYDDLSRIGVTAVGASNAAKSVSDPTVSEESPKVEPEKVELNVPDTSGVEPSPSEPAESATEDVPAEESSGEGTVPEQENESPTEPGDESVPASKKSTPVDKPSATDDLEWF